MVPPSMDKSVCQELRRQCKIGQYRRSVGDPSHTMQPVPNKRFLVNLRNTHRRPLPGIVLSAPGGLSPFCSSFNVPSSCGDCTWYICIDHWMTCFCASKVYKMASGYNLQSRKSIGCLYILFITFTFNTSSSFI